MSDKKTYGKWYIASLQLSHSDSCDAQRRLTTRQIAELPAFTAAVQENPKASVESLMALVLERHAVSLDKQIRLVYRARDLVRTGKVVARSNILPSQDSPLPPRQFIQRHIRIKKAPPEPQKTKNPDRMAWTDTLIESLLIERIVKHGKQFVEAPDQSQKRELWGTIHREFSAMHALKVTVTQLRAKFRYLQEQYLRVRAEEEEAAKDPDKLVVYPRCWDMLAEYFGDEGTQGSPSVDVEPDAVLPEAGISQAVSLPLQVENGFPVPAQSVTVQSAAMPSVPVQPSFAQSVPVYSAPMQVFPQTQATVARQEPMPVRSDMPQKRRKVNPPQAAVAQQDSHAAASANVPPSDVAEKLETIQNTQTEMAKTMDGMKQVVEQSNEAIRGLQQALSQSNQVNAALLDFLRRQPSL
ncbi:unnamed protein product [Phytophthora lilii]|uniref:Unnamed protein product n=1 Tax=Phytophthora lilii TaxID=2077276 RepID=A0A9W6TTB4_9STRA|nr:unnamed protein product [Phytophthora lilii]